MKIFFYKARNALTIKYLPSDKARVLNDIPGSILNEAIAVYNPRVTQIMKCYLKKVKKFRMNNSQIVAITPRLKIYIYRKVKNKRYRPQCIL